MKKIILFSLITSYVSAQQYFDVVIATGQNNIAGISHPAIENNDTIYVFIKNDYRYRVGFPTSLLKLGKDGSVYSNDFYLDTIDSYRIFDVAKERDDILICGVRQLQTDGSRIIMYGSINSNMDTVWIKTITSEYNHPGVYKIMRLQNGNISMVGDDSHIRPTGGAYSNKNHAIFILTDSLGNILKYTHFEKPDSNNLEGLKYIMQSSSGDIYCVGQIQISTLYNKGLVIKLNKDGEFIWRKEIEQSKYGYTIDFCKELPDGRILLVGGKYQPFFVEKSKIWTCLVEIDKSGKILSEKLLFEENSASYLKCVTNLEGSIICTGFVEDTFATKSYGYLIKFRDNGSGIWRRQFTHGWKDRDEVFSNIANAVDGGYYLTGYNWVPGDNSSKAWIVKVDSNGCVMPGCNTAVNVEKEHYKTLFHLFPNPVGDRLIIYLNDQDLQDRRYMLNCYDQNGRVILTREIIGRKSDIDVSFLPSGLYYYQIDDRKRILQNGKLVKL